MRRNKLWLLPVMLGLIFSLIACGPKATPVVEEAAPPPIEATPTPRPGEATPTPVEATPTPKPVEAAPTGDFWADIPIYPGATYQGPEPCSVELEYYKECEQRRYESKDSPEKVCSFYKVEIPKKGWQEAYWGESEVSCGGAWQKRDGEILSDLNVFEWIENTVIVIVRAEGKK